MAQLPQRSQPPVTPVTTDRIHAPRRGLVYILLGQLLMTIGGCAAVSLFILQCVNEARSGNTSVSEYSPGLIPMLVLAGIASCGTALIRQGKKLRAIPAAQLLETDPRSPVLYLRSFAADGQEIPFTTPPSRTFLQHFGIFVETPTEEEDLAQVFSEIGPFITVGNPRDKLPEVGASRMYVSNEDWQRVVGDLMNKARLIMLRAGTSPGFLWELERIVKCVPPQKIVIYIYLLKKVP